jgi:hypothetical protein
MVWHNTYVVCNEFESAVLSEDRNKDFVACLAIIVDDGQTSCMCLNKHLAGVIERPRGVDEEQARWRDVELLLNI